MYVMDSPQAKGRVERNHGVYQDRFVKELKLEGITTIEEANKLLQGGFYNTLNLDFPYKNHAFAKFRYSHYKQTFVRRFMFHIFLKNLKNAIKSVFRLKITIHTRIGKRGITTEEACYILILISSHNRFQYFSPLVSTVYIAITQHHSFNITVLVEAEQWMITTAPKVSVIGRTFLIAVCGTY